MAGLMKVDQIANSAGTGAPSFPFGALVNKNPSGAYNIANANYTISDSDGYQTVLSSTILTSARTVTLPAAANNIGRLLTIAKLDSGAFVINIATNGSDTINGATGVTANILNAQYSYLTLYCISSSAWCVISACDYIISTISSPTNAALSNTLLGLTNITVPPGQWDLAASATNLANSATFTGASQFVVGTTTASTAGSTSGLSESQMSQPTTASGQTISSFPRIPVNLTSAQQYFLNVLAIYSGGTPQWRGTLSARRFG